MAAAWSRRVAEAAEAAHAAAAAAEAAMGARSAGSGRKRPRSPGPVKEEEEEEEEKVKEEQAEVPAFAIEGYVALLAEVGITEPKVLAEFEVLCRLRFAEAQELLDLVLRAIEKGGVHKPVNYFRHSMSQLRQRLGLWK